MNRLLLGFLLLLCMSVTGCGSGLSQLSGKVTMDDKPLPGGTVVFVTEDGSKTEHVQIQSDGTYTSNRIPRGDLRVAVMPPPKSPTASMPKGAKLPPNVSPDNPQAQMYLKAAAPTVEVPAALQNPKTSNLTVKVDSSQKTYDIPLKST